MGLPVVDREIFRPNIWTTVNWAVCDGDVPIMMALLSILVMEDQCVVAEQKFVGDRDRPNKRYTG